MNILIAVLWGTTGGIIGGGSVHLCRFLIGVRRAIRAENRAVNKAKECLKCDL